MSKFEYEAQFLGNDVEQAYANVFGTEVVGGIGDGGLDVETGDKELPFIQIKSSLEGAKPFLKESLRRKKFIPIAIGEPGSKEEMIESLKKFGGWIGKDESESLRQKTLDAISQVRDFCQGKNIPALAKVR